GDVAEADVLHEAIAPERVERTHAGGKRRPRVGGVQLIEMDAIDDERLQAGFAGREEMTCAAIGDPVALRSGEAALRGDADPRPISSPRRKCAGDQTFVVSDF